EFLEAAWTSAAAGAAVPLDLSAASFASFAEVRALAAVRALGWWTMSGFTLDADAVTGGASPAGADPAAASDVRTLVVGAREVERYRGEVARAVDDVRRLQQQGWRLVMATEGHGPAQRMVEQLRAAEVPARLVGGV